MATNIVDVIAPPQLSSHIGLSGSTALIDHGRHLLSHDGDVTVMQHPLNVPVSVTTPCIDSGTGDLTLKRAGSDALVLEADAVRSKKRRLVLDQTPLTNTIESAEDLEIKRAAATIMTLSATGLDVAAGLKVTQNEAPSSGDDLCNKTYVDATLSEGITQKTTAEVMAIASPFSGETYSVSDYGSEPKLFTYDGVRWANQKWAKLWTGNTTLPVTLPYACSVTPLYVNTWYVLEFSPTANATHQSANYLNTVPVFPGDQVFQQWIYLNSPYRHNGFRYYGPTGVAYRVRFGATAVLNTGNQTCFFGVGVSQTEKSNPGTLPVASDICPCGFVEMDCKSTPEYFSCVSEVTLTNLDYIFPCVAVRSSTSNVPSLFNVSLIIEEV